MRTEMKATWVSKTSQFLLAGVFLGFATWNAEALLPVYFNVDFEGDTIGQEPSQGPSPLPTATAFTGLGATVPNLFVTNNLWGNATKFAYFDTVGGHASTMNAQINVIDQPTNGTLRVAMDLASGAIVSTTFWMPLSFSDGNQIWLDFLDNGKFRVENGVHTVSEFGHYEVGKFTNIEFRISMDAMIFDILTVNGSTTNVLLAGMPTGVAPGSKFESITPGPVNLVGAYQFGIDNVVIEIIPEPTSVSLALAGSVALAMIRRRLRS